MSKLMQRLKAEEQSVENPVQEGAMKVRFAKNVKLTVGELREAVSENPDHPVAQAVTRTLQMPDSQEIFMDKTNIEALVEDREVREERIVRKNNQGVNQVGYHKVLGEKRKPQPKATTSSPKNKD